MSSKSLLDSVKALRQACERQDWEAIQRIDKQINMLIREELSIVRSEQEGQRLSTYLKSIQRECWLHPVDLIVQRGEMSPFILVTPLFVVFNYKNK